MSVLVRERPPLRTYVRALTPSGRSFRWGPDERRAANVPQDKQWSSTIPGGWQNLDCKLVRDPGTDYSDLDRLSTLRVEGAGGRCAGEYRLERAPRVSGDQMAISPSAVGWQAALEDNKAAREVIVDIDLTQWIGPSVQRKLNDIANLFQALDPQQRPDPATGMPSLDLQARDSWQATTRPSAEGWYDIGPGAQIGKIYYGWKINQNVNSGDAQWSWTVYLADNDVLAHFDSSGSLRAAGPGSGSLSASANSTRRWAVAQLSYGTGPAGSAGGQYDCFFTLLAVVGNHGLTPRNATTYLIGPTFLASDVCSYVVGKYASLVTVDPANVEATQFGIPHLAFRDLTTAAEMVKGATRFELNDWAVWDHPRRIAQPQFHLHPRNTYGRKWRARVGPSGLQETGPQIDRLWNSVEVQFDDVIGIKRTVGPPGSGADTEDASLADSDPTNPANEMGIKRRALLTMGTATAPAAIQVGKVFLGQAKLLDRSGQAKLTGHVLDDRGVMHPYWAVRAGDTISFVDAHDTSARRIVKVDNDERTDSCSIDLDVPPEGLQALLERFSVALVRFGLS